MGKKITAKAAGKMIDKMGGIPGVKKGPRHMAKKGLSAYEKAKAGGTLGLGFGGPAPKKVVVAKKKVSKK